MLFCVKTPTNKLYVFGMALLLAATLAGCGGGGTVALPPPSTDDGKFAARSARAAAETAKMDAVDAMDGDDGSVAMTAAAAGDADMYATNAAGSASMAMKARADYAKAKMASADADAENAKAMAAKKAADDARAALTEAVAAYEAAVKDQDIETKAGATAIKTAADALRKAAMKAQKDAMAAQTAAEAARDMAMAAAADAAMYAAAHGLGLLMAANDVDQTNAKARAARIEEVATKIAAAAASTDSNDSRSSGAASATATWPADTPDDPETDDDEFVAGLLSVTINGMSGDNVESETRPSKDNTDPPDGDFDDDGDIKNNADKIDGLPGFPHGFDITDGESHIIAFTDKKQGTAAVKAKTITLRNHAVMASRIVTNEDASPTGALDDLGANTKYDHDGNPDTLPVAGAYSCAAGGNCVVAVTDGKVTGITGPVLFNAVPDTLNDTTGAPNNGQGIIQAYKAADVMDDYLVFGVWMDEDADGQGSETAPDFGAFASAGSTFTITDALTGKATYNGAAAGVYTNGAKVDYFQASATLNADFGAADAAGKITGTISNIVAGGVSMSDVINLNIGTSESNINVDTNVFSGNARMGAPKVTDDEATYPYNGTWSGLFAGPAAETGATGVDLLPPAVAGTFGVTGTDNMGTPDTKDDVTRSYVGAFGARR